MNTRSWLISFSVCLFLILLLLSFLYMCVFVCVCVCVSEDPTGCCWILSVVMLWCYLELKHCSIPLWGVKYTHLRNHILNLITCFLNWVQYGCTLKKKQKQKENRGQRSRICNLHKTSFPTDIRPFMKRLWFNESCVNYFIRRSLVNSYDVLQFHYIRTSSQSPG